MNVTPTPWHLVDNGMYLEIVVPWKDEPEIVNQYCPTIATAQYEGNDGLDGRANAALIVKAVNAHEQLIESLKTLIDFVEAVALDHDVIEKAIRLANAGRDALAAAGEQV